MKKYFTSSLKGELFRLKTNRVIMWIALFSLLSGFFIVKAQYDQQAQYESLQANFEQKLNEAYDSYEQLLLFMERVESDKANYQKAIEYQKIRENRKGWKFETGF